MHSATNQRILGECDVISCHEGRAFGSKFVHNASKGPNVALIIVRHFFNHFRRDIERSANSSVSKQRLRNNSKLLRVPATRVVWKSKPASPSCGRVQNPQFWYYHLRPERHSNNSNISISYECGQSPTCGLMSRWRILRSCSAFIP
jgi:hypothetical protein